MANKERYTGLRAEILFNETKKGTAEYKSIEEISSRFGCSVAYTYRVRYLLGLKDIMPQRISTPTMRLDSAVTDTGALEELLNEPLIAPLDRLRVLSRLIRVGAPVVKIQAIKAYEELTRTSEGRIGPGPPLTRDDKVARLAKLLMALAPDITMEAWEVAYGYKPTTAPASSPVSSEPKRTRGLATTIIESMHDLPLPPAPKPFPSSRPLSSDDASEGTPL